MYSNDAVTAELLKDIDVVFWEWGWTPEHPANILKIRSLYQGPILVFPGAPDRFMRNTPGRDWPLHMQAASACTHVGVMIEDSIPWYQALCPQAKVFHLPVPLPTDRYRPYANTIRAIDRTQPIPVMLSAPTTLNGESSRLEHPTFLIFKALREKYPVKGLCFSEFYDQDQADVRAFLTSLGLENDVTLSRYMPEAEFLKAVAAHPLAIFMPHMLVQGRMAMVQAALGIPTICSKEISTHRHLFSQTSVGWFDIPQAVQLATRLIEDADFYRAVQQHALSAAEFYNSDACLARLTEALRR